MKKLKLLMSLATMCLAIAVLCFGVFSATQVNYNIGGTISYEVTDAFVKVNTKVYKGTNLYNRGQLELLSEDFANGTKTLASEGFSQDTSFSFDEFDSTNSSAFTKENINLNFSSTNKSYVVEMDIQNLSPSVNVWAIAEWSVDDNSNVVQGNNVMQKAITSTESKKIYYVISVEDFKSGISSISYTMNLKIGNGDYSQSQENLDKATYSWNDSLSVFVAKPKDAEQTGLYVFPESYSDRAHSGKVTIDNGTINLGTDEFTQRLASATGSFVGKFTTIVLPDTMTEMPALGFSGAFDLTRILMPKNYTINAVDANNGILGSGGYIANTGIYSVRINENVDAIATIGCTNLMAVEIGKDVSALSWTDFYGCTSLETIKIDENNTTYSTKINGQECYGIVEISTKTLCVATRNTIIQEGIVNLGMGLSYGAWNGKEEITIPTSVKLIGDESLRDCSSTLKIRYLGTVAQWGQITISNSSCIPNGAIIQCTDGSTVFNN